ncbi:hypothetical protein EB061_13035, partial [bacterium]|nr:hypothetical protein [bacterium]
MEQDFLTGKSAERGTRGGIMATSRKDNIVEVSESTRLRYFKNLAAQIHQLRLAMERSDNET